ncbi:hypothetical protein [Methylobacter psychrophilus]|uniref:hypothetical protein n=1 Tax=Methylobacter psychrophilus TaxID=96941 RepID=UPI0021D4D045|nr:hypothetical protein [Methylobacter psychrophilus]
MKLVFIRTLKTMFIFALLLVIGAIDEWTAEGIFIGLYVAAHVHAVGFAIWTGIIFGLIGIYELIKKIRTRSQNNEGVYMGSKITQLKSWYTSVTKKQRNLLWVSAILISAIPIVGWVFIAPWLIPLMLFLEYHRT